MEFFATNGKRPIRLSNATRRFAYESLNYKYGKETWETQGVSMDDCENFEELSPLQKYDAAIERIVKEAPIRICEGEKISGAATFGNAINHVVPATFNGKPFCYSVSHLTIDFETVLKKGVNHLLKQAEESLKEYKGTEKEPFVLSCLHCLNCMKIWHERYLNELKNKSEYIKTLSENQLLYLLAFMKKMFGSH